MTGRIYVTFTTSLTCPASPGPRSPCTPAAAHWTCSCTWSWEGMPGHSQSWLTSFQPGVSDTRHPGTPGSSALCRRRWKHPVIWISEISFSFHFLSCRRNLPIFDSFYCSQGGVEVEEVLELLRVLENFWVVLLQSDLDNRIILLSCTYCTISDIPAQGLMKRGQSVCMAQVRYEIMRWCITHMGMLVIDCAKLKWGYLKGLCLLIIFVLRNFFCSPRPHAWW